MARSPQRELKTSQYLIILAVIGTIFYLPFLSRAFLIDDFNLIVHNPQVHSLSRLSDTFIHPAKSHYGHYRPLSNVLRAFLYAFFKQDPWRYRVANMFFFIGFCSLIFVFIHRLTEDRFVAFLTALGMLVHPINIFVVQYITAHEITFTGLSMLGSIFCFLQYLKMKQAGYYAGSVALFLAALLSHEMSVILPVYLYGVSVYLSQPIVEKDKRRLMLPFVAIAMVFIVFKFITAGTVVQESSRIFSGRFTDVWMWTGVLGQLVGWYVLKLFYPSGLLWIWNIPVQAAGGIGAAAVFVVGCAVLAGIGIVLFKRKALEGFALLWFLAGFIPLGAFCLVMPDIGFVIEPHWFFFSSIGFFFLIALTIGKLAEWLPQGWGMVIPALLVIYCGYWAAPYQLVWKNERTYCTYWLTVSPNNPIPKGRLALEHIKHGQFALAIDLLEEIRDEHNFSPRVVYANLGLCYLNLGKADLARENALMAIESDPTYALAYHLLGSVEVYEKDYGAAENDFLKAIELGPNLIEPRMSLGDLYFTGERYDQALRIWREGQRMDPTNKEFEKRIRRVEGM